LAGDGGDDVMIADRVLPGLDGLGVVGALRGVGVKAPGLFLTALRGVGDRVQGLEPGGDDYLVKPFALHGSYLYLGDAGPGLLVRLAFPA